MRIAALVGALLLLVGGVAHAQVYGYHGYGGPAGGPVGPAVAGGSQPPVNPTPTLQDNTVNFGALTRAAQGSVLPSNLMYANGSTLATSWSICQASGTAGYWELVTSAGGVSTISNCPTTSSFNDGTGYIVAPTTTGAAADLGGNTNATAIATFTIKATNASGTSAGHTLTINRKANGANLSQPPTQVWPWTVTMGGLTLTNTFVGEGSTNTFQNFVSACRPNCFIAFSTGTLGSNPNNGAPSSGQAFFYKFNQWNYGAAVFALTGNAPGAGEYLTYEDADSIGDGGTPTGTSRHTIFDGIEFNGVAPSGQAGVAWLCNPTAVGGVPGWAAANGSNTTTYTNVYDLTIGGNQLANYTSPYHYGIWLSGTCNTTVNYLFGGYKMTRDANYNVTSLTLNQFTPFAFAPMMMGNQNLNVTINYLTCVVVFSCYGDNGSGTTGLFSNNITVNHMWVRYFGQHAISTNYNQNITFNDCYMFSGFQSPAANIHIDYFQVTDNINAPNIGVNRCMLVGADSNSYGLTIFGANTGATNVPRQGWKFNWVISFGKDYAGFVVQSMDSLTTRQAELQYMDLIRENYVTDPTKLGDGTDDAYTIGTNIGSLNAGVTFIHGNMQNGDIWTLQSCNLDQTVPISPGSHCVGGTTNVGTITFLDSGHYVGAAGTVLIGSTLCNASTGTAPCTTGSTLSNLQAAIGQTTDTTGNTCTTQGPIGVALGICQGAWSNEPVGTGSPGTSIYELTPASALIHFALVPSGTSCSTTCTLPNVVFDNALLANYPNYPVSGGQINLQGVNRFQQTGTCPATGTAWCGFMHMNSLVVWDTIFPCPTSSATSACTKFDMPDILTAGLANIATVDNVPGTSQSNVFIVGSHCGSGIGLQPTPPCNNLAAQIGFPTSNFTADGSLGAEANAESHPYTFFQAMGAKTLVAYFAGLVCPAAGGNLDPKGDQSVATGALDFSCNWNGAGLKPGYDLVNDAVNPWPH